MNPRRLKQQKLHRSPLCPGPHASYVRQNFFIYEVRSTILDLKTFVNHIYEVRSTILELKLLVLCYYTTILNKLFSPFALCLMPYALYFTYLRSTKYDLRFKNIRTSSFVNRKFAVSTGELSGDLLWAKATG